jgi:hypothetical protein
MKKSFKLSNSIHQISSYTFLWILYRTEISLKQNERNLTTEILKPKNIRVNLKGGGQANVAVFNLEAMILSLILDENLMHPNNIAEGYDIFTGKGSDPDVFMVKSTLGMHGNQPENIFCGDDPSNMPLAVVVFGD